MYVYRTQIVNNPDLFIGVAIYWLTFNVWFDADMSNDWENAKLLLKYTIYVRISFCNILTYFFFERSKHKIRSISNNIRNRLVPFDTKLNIKSMLKSIRFESKIFPIHICLHLFNRYFAEAEIIAGIMNQSYTSKASFLVEKSLDLCEEPSSMVSWILLITIRLVRLG